jgi:hypothetical protein
MAGKLRRQRFVDPRELVLSAQQKRLFNEWLMSHPTAYEESIRDVS